MTKHWFSFQNLRYCEQFQYLINIAPHWDNNIFNYSLLVEILDTIDQYINVINEINKRTMIGAFISKLMNDLKIVREMTNYR